MGRKPKPKIARGRKPASSVTGDTGKSKLVSTPKAAPAEAASAKPAPDKTARAKPAKRARTAARSVSDPALAETQPTKPAPESPMLQRRAATQRMSIAGVLIGGFSTLVLVAVGAVLWIGVYAARENTNELLQKQAQLITDAVAEKISEELGPPAAQAEFLARQLREEAIGTDDPAELSEMLFAAMAGSPQTSGLAFLNRDFEGVGVRRVDDEFDTVVLDFSRAEAAIGAMRASVDAPRPYWGPLVWAERLKTTALNMRAPVRRDGEFIGMVVAVVPIGNLSEHLDALNLENGMTSFVLTDDDRVLAHPSLIGGFPGLGPEHLLPSLSEIGDPVLPAVRAETAADGLIERRDIEGGVTIRSVKTVGDEWVFVTRSLEGFGPEPWTVGAYFPRVDIDAPIKRLQNAIYAGLGVLVLAVFLAWFAGRAIARPIGRLARAADAIGKLELRATDAVGGSWLAELDDAGHAFDRMVSGLRRFQTYVPGRLVQRLLHMKIGETTASETREVTVLFSDIAGFTQQSEKLSAEATGEFLNQHFALLGRCIEAEDGTIDKYIGDSVMAFWGAPDDQPDHARRAVACARAIQEALAADNDARRARGEAVVRVRIGIHSGPALVGNIGSPGRINYTIVGDTVNIAQRLEQLGKDFVDPERDATVLLSANVADRLGRDVRLSPAGVRQLRGRAAPLKVFLLG